jgi:hypothetical protein
VYNILADIAKICDFSLVKTDTGESFVTGRANLDVNQQDVISEAEFWREVYKLERKLGIRFDIPDQLDPQEISHVYELMQIVNTGIVPMGKGTVTLNFSDDSQSREEIDKLIEVRQNGKLSFKCTEKQNHQLVVLGRQIIFNPRLIVIPAFELLGHSVTADIATKMLQLECTCKTILIVYPEYYGTDDMLEILAKEGYSKQMTVDIKT